MKILFCFFILCIKASAWSLFSGLQRFLYGYQPNSWQKRPSLRFDKEDNCTTFISKLHKIHSIVYNYGLDENNTGARDLVNCLSRDDAAGPRSAVQEIILIAPIIGLPKPRQKAFIDLIDMLPTLSNISVTHQRLYKVHNWIYEDGRRRNQSWTVAYLQNDFRRGYNQEDLFDECSSESISFDGGFGTGLDRIYRAMSVCDNIRSLDISISQGGCVIESDINSFDWKSGDKFSTLHELKLSGYGWVNERTFTRAERRPASTISWKATMDWSKLKRLNIDRPPPEFLDAYEGELTGLKSLQIRPKWNFWGDETTFCSFDQNATELRQKYTRFIKTLPPLQELSISGMGELLNITDILTIHGPSLENLTVHEFERDCRLCGNTTWGRPTLSINELRSISELAPNLKYLEVDVYRRRSWPYKIFEPLSRFPNLTALTLWFDLEDPYEQKTPEQCYLMDKYCKTNVAMEPRLDEEAALKIYRALRAGQDPQKLERATLRTGNFGRRRGGGMRANPIDKGYHPATFDCKSLLRGEECTGPYNRGHWDIDDD